MLAHSRLREPQVLDEVTHAVLTGGKVLHNRQAGRICEGLEKVRVRGCCPLIQNGALLYYHRHISIISLGCDYVE